MRVVAAHPGPAFSVHDVYAGWVEALRGLGAHVIEFNLDARLTFYGSALIEAGEGRFRRALTGEQATELAVNGLYATLYKAKPDVLLIVSGFFLPADLLDRARSHGTRVVMVHTESPYEDDRQLALAGHADLNLLNDPTNIDRFTAAGPTRYVPHAYRPSLHHPGAPDPKLACDLGFVGTGYPSRIGFLEAMAAGLDGLDVLLAGNWQLLDDSSPLRRWVAHQLDECLDNADTARVYQSARCGMNLYRREAQAEQLAAGWAMGPREVEMAACGLFFLRDPRGEGDEVLDMLPTFAGPEDAAEQLRWWLAHDDQRAAAAAAAREAVADRTFDHHAAALLRLLDAQPSGR